MDNSKRKAVNPVNHVNARHHALPLATMEAGKGRRRPRQYPPFPARTGSSGGEVGTGAHHSTSSPPPLR